MSRPTDQRTQWLRGWQFVLIAWLAAFATRPLLLGFYDSDWEVLLQPTLDTAPFSMARFAGLMTIFANRPLFGLYHYLLSSLCGASPLLWHSAIALVCLATALTLRWFLAELLRLCGARDQWAADVGAALWLTCPWALGATWATTSPDMLAVLFFTLGGAVLFRNWRAGHAKWLLPSALFLIGCLAYEALYGQFVIWLLIGWFTGVWRRLGFKKLAMTTAALASAQALAIAWNRVVPLLTSVAPSKSFNQDWPRVILASLKDLPWLVRLSAPEVSPAVELLFASGFCLAGGLLIWRIVRRHRRQSAWRLAEALSACAVGLLIGCVLLALANYKITGVGLAGRTTIALSLWLATAWALAGGCVPSRMRTWRYAYAAISVTLVALLSVATQQRLQDWRGAWQIEQRIIEQAPADEFAQARPDAVILLIGPHKYNGVNTFAYTWDLDGAMGYAYPELRHLKFLPARGDWRTSWDGVTLEQAKRAVFNRVATSEVWIWRESDDSARRAGAPWQSSVTASESDQTLAADY